MTLPAAPRRIVLASQNPGKFREIQSLLSGLDLELIPQAELGAAAAEETAPTFIENAILKARGAARRSGLPAVADDSGLEVDALNGAPGVRSARYAADDATDAQNTACLLDALAEVPEASRTARFRCVVVLLRHPDDPSPLIGQGVWEGRILKSPRGARGFGYDPVFFVPERNCTAAELDADEKNRLSHRGQALRALLDQLEKLRLRVP